MYKLRYNKFYPHHSCITHVIYLFKKKKHKVIKNKSPYYNISNIKYVELVHQHAAVY